MNIANKVKYVAPLLIAPALLWSSGSAANQCAHVHSERAQDSRSSKSRVQREIVEVQTPAREKFLEKAQTYERIDLIDSFDKLLMIREKTRDLSVRATMTDLLTAVDNFRDLRMQDFALKIESSLSLAPNFNQLKKALIEAIPEIYTRKEASVMAEAYLTKRSPFSRLLPRLTQEQVVKRVMGNIPGEIAPNSLMGRFLAEAQKIKGLPLAVERRAFFSPPNQRNKIPQKWFIPIDASLFPLYQKYFSGDHFLTHFHDHGQNTLFITYNEKAGSYARFDRLPRMQNPNSLWPSILLSSAEANRMKMFVQMGLKENDLAQYPWNLGDWDSKTNRPVRYVEEGYFTCCTHWFGNIPLGESRVDRYIFPGNDPSSVREAEPVVTKFGPNTRSNFDDSAYNREEFYDNTDTALEYSQMVWTKPGHMQLWEVLGLKNSQITGELANPGYVAFALITKTKEDRVPFVFVTVREATDPLPSNEVMKNQRWIEVE